jgi:hypothetical protein
MQDEQAEVCPQKCRKQKRQGGDGVSTAMQEDKEAEGLHGVVTATQEAEAEVVGLLCVFTTSMPCKDQEGHHAVRGSTH